MHAVHILLCYLYFETDRFYPYPLGLFTDPSTDATMALVSMKRPSRMWSTTIIRLGPFGTIPVYVDGDRWLKKNNLLTVAYCRPIALGNLVNNGLTWWRHQMETFSALQAFCVGNWPVTGEFPSQRSLTRSFDFFYLRQNKRLSKQSKRRWFDTPSRSLWRHCNE